MYKIQKPKKNYSLDYNNLSNLNKNNTNNINNNNSMNTTNNGISKREFKVNMGYKSYGGGGTKNNSSNNNMNSMNNNISPNQAKSKSLNGMFVIRNIMDSNNVNNNSSNNITSNGFHNNNGSGGMNWNKPYNKKFHNSNNNNNKNITNIIINNCISPFKKKENRSMLPNLQSNKIDSILQGNMNYNNNQGNNMVNNNSMNNNMGNIYNNTNNTNNTKNNFYSPNINSKQHKLGLGGSPNPNYNNNSNYNYNNNNNYISNTNNPLSSSLKIKNGALVKEFQLNYQEDIPTSNNFKSSISNVGSNTRAGKINPYQTKINQDSFINARNLLSTDFHIFAVFDGHGTQGHHISGFVKSNILAYFKNKRLYKTSSFNSESIYNCLCENNYYIVKNSFQLIEIALTKTKYEANLSGTTAVMVIVVNNIVICSNAGDSRAIMSTRSGIKELSFDHKPDLEAEKSRITKAGGRVHAFKEGGQYLGPARVWVKSGEYPGLAMSRSLGDFMAKSVGCIATPGKF